MVTPEEEEAGGAGGMGVTRTSKQKPCQPFGKAASL